MAHKSQQQHPGDDWAGLAQNLFGINLDKPKSGDDDLLDDDMFKVELPKPPAPPPVVVTTAAQPVAQDEIEFAPAEPAVPAAAAQAPTRTATAAAANRPTSTKAALPPQKAAVVAPKSDSFGAGLDDFGFGVVETNQTSHLVEEDDDDGLTLPEDYDSEGLTLPSDYDDGLTLAPEALSDDECDEDEEDDEEFEDDDSDDEELSADEDFEDDDEASDESDADDEAEAGAETSISGQASAAPASSDAPRPKRPFVELAKTLIGICSKTGNGKKFLPVTHREPMEAVHHPVDVVETETEIEKVPGVEARVIVDAVVIARVRIVRRLNNATDLPTDRPIGPLHQTDQRQQTGPLHQTSQLPTITFASNDHSPKIVLVQRSVRQLAHHVADQRKVPEIVVDRRVMIAVVKRDLVTRNRVKIDHARIRERQQAPVLRQGLPLHPKMNSRRLMISA